MKICRFIFYKYYFLNKFINDDTTEGLADHSIGLILVSMFFYLLGFMTLISKMLDINFKVKLDITIGILVLIIGVILFMILSFFVNRQKKVLSIVQEFKGKKDNVLEVIYLLYNAGAIFMAYYAIVGF